MVAFRLRGVSHFGIQVEYLRMFRIQVNPRLTGVSAERHWPGGGAYNAPPG